MALSDTDNPEVKCCFYELSLTPESLIKFILTRARKSVLLGGI